MAGTDAIRDGNRITVALGVSNADSTATLPFKIDSVTGRLLVSTGGTAPNTFIYNEIASGSGTSFTIAHTPATGLYAVYAAGQHLYPTTDYSLSGTTITTVNSWAAGDILVDYQY